MLSSIEVVSNVAIRRDKFGGFNRRGWNRGRAESRTTRSVQLWWLCVAKGRFCMDVRAPRLLDCLLSKLRGRR